MKSFKEKNYEQALIETFLKFDDLLRSKKINNLLKKFHKKTIVENYEIDMKISFNKNDEYLLNEIMDQENNNNENTKFNNGKIYKLYLFIH
jgi:hypothetical protein